MTPIQYCENKVSHYGSSFYYSFLFLDKQQQSVIAPLYAFYREVNDIKSKCSDAQVAKNKIQWWAEELYITFNNSQQQPNHPVCLALKPLISPYSLKLEYFLDILRGVEMDINFRGFQSFAELKEYCYYRSGALSLLSTEIMGYQQPQTLQYAKIIGDALRLTHILVDIKNDLSHSRLYIPEEELQRFGVSTEILSKGEHNAEQHTALQKLFTFQVERVESYYQKALAILPNSDRYSQRGGLIMAAIYSSHLKKIKKHNYPFLHRRVTLNPFYKLWLAWSTARKEYQHFNPNEP